jgi:hypothetical protein
MTAKTKQPAAEQAKPFVIDGRVMLRMARKYSYEWLQANAIPYADADLEDIASDAIVRTLEAFDPTRSKQLWLVLKHRCLEACRAYVTLRHNEVLTDDPESHQGGGNGPPSDR